MELYYYFLIINMSNNSGSGSAAASADAKRAAKLRVSDPDALAKEEKKGASGADDG